MGLPGGQREETCRGPDREDDGDLKKVFHRLSRSCPTWSLPYFLRAVIDYRGGSRFGCPDSCQMFGLSNLLRGHVLREYGFVVCRLLADVTGGSR